jgi:hypothetical protein
LGQEDARMGIRVRVLRDLRVGKGIRGKRRASGSPNKLSPASVTRRASPSSAVGFRVWSREKLRRGDGDGEYGVLGVSVIRRGEGGVGPPCRAGFVTGFNSAVLRAKRGHGPYGHHRLHLHLQSACMESERRPTTRAPSSSVRDRTKRACNGDATCERIESDRERICSRRSVSHAFVSEWQALRIEQENRRGLYVQIYYMMVGSYWCSLIDPCLLALAPGSSDQLTT